MYQLALTRSFTHQIFRLPAGGDALEIWSEDPLFEVDWQEGNWTLNGIDWDGDASIYVSRTDNDEFYRVSIENDDSTGAVQQIVVEGILTNMGYDDIVALDSDSSGVICLCTGGFSWLVMVWQCGGTG